MDDLHEDHSCIDWLEPVTEISNTYNKSDDTWWQDSIQTCNKCGRSFAVLAKVTLIPEEEE